MKRYSLKLTTENGIAGTATRILKEDKNGNFVKYEDMVEIVRKVLFDYDWPKADKESIEYFIKEYC